MLDGVDDSFDAYSEAAGQHADWEPVVGAIVFSRR
jgi:hypothetical protein